MRIYNMSEIEIDTVGEGEEDRAGCRDSRACTGKEER